MMIDTSTTLLRALCKAYLGLTTGLTTTHRTVGERRRDRVVLSCAAAAPGYFSHSIAPTCFTCPGGSNTAQAAIISALLSVTPIPKSNLQQTHSNTLYPVDPVLLASPNDAHVCQILSTRAPSLIPASRLVKAQMLFASYVVAVIVLALLSLLFLIARFSAKRTMRLPWTIDDTLLLLSLVESAPGHVMWLPADMRADMPVHCHRNLLCRRVIPMLDRSGHKSDAKQPWSPVMSTSTYGLRPDRDYS